MKYAPSGRSNGHAHRVPGDDRARADLCIPRREYGSSYITETVIQVMVKGLSGGQSTVGTGAQGVLREPLGSAPNFAQ
jgi:hypothetical protein